MKNDIMRKPILVVAFDGMDKELIEEFECRNILEMKEYGYIDNNSGITSRVTSELFASFITGETHEVHGVRGLTTTPLWKKRILNILAPDFLVKNIRGVNRLKEALSTFLGKGVKHSKTNLESKTLFEEISSSKPLYIPSYNPEFEWVIGYPVAGLEKGYSRERIMKEAREDTEARLRKGRATQPSLFGLSKDFWDFVMVHFHDPDTIQDIGVRGENLKQEYKRLDSIAGEIKEEFEDWTVIFMSDHGMIESQGKFWEHNKNAFYSCNLEIFGAETPHITDFYHKILEITDTDS